MDKAAKFEATLLMVKEKAIDNLNKEEKLAKQSIENLKKKNNKITIDIDKLSMQITKIKNSEDSLNKEKLNKINKLTEEIKNKKKFLMKIKMK